ncbi:MAG: dTMP kinase [Raoultibacter sp.]|jgi:dTMP kinase
MVDESEQSRVAHPGVFISFEGGEGAGKSTHIRFLAESLEHEGYEVLCLREPGGTLIGESLRELVLDPAHGEMTDEAELLIYEAARAQIVSEVIKPALAKSCVVLCDRFFDSTVAYQVYGRGLSADFVREANRFASQGLQPDRTILLTCGEAGQIGLERATQHSAADRLELAGDDFHTRVNEGFVKIAQENPERIMLVASSDKKSQTARAVFAALSDIFSWMADEEHTQDAYFSRLDTDSQG